jgi:hypothetical protein
VSRHKQAVAHHQKITDRVDKEKVNTTGLNPEEFQIPECKKCLTEDD